ncbi:hypothetical protein ACFYXS_14325 [Streptomyces sp. NPDC002574]|uniref:hypothetical protein n=1 Tax=Streptomyces sp. NPDC002574 TaxID=3364652 RepID=UPI003676BC04
MNHHVTHVPDGLSVMTASFLHFHAVRVEPLPVERYRATWLGLGIPVEVIDRAAAYQARWGGFLVPPAPRYEGGPHVLSADLPFGTPEEGWWFAAGDQRCSLPYGFMIAPDGAFGIRGARWTPLHAHVEGWVESVALAHRAAGSARRITQVSGDAVEGLDLDALDPVPRVAGIADTWWRGPDSLVAVYRGEAEHFGRPGYLRADVYEGLPEDAFWFDR